MRRFKPIDQRTRLEKDIEREHREWAEKAGWFVTKITGTSTDGFPDRFYAKDGRVVLMEWKRKGAPLRALQKIRIAELKKAGVEVHVVRTIRRANRILSGT